MNTMEMQTGYPSKDRPWLKYYSEDSKKLELPDKKAYDLVYERNKAYPKEVAIEFMGAEITFEEFFAMVESVSKSLLAIGVKQGDIITIAMATTPEMAYLFYGANRIGATINALDPRYTYEEFKQKIVLTGSRYFFGIPMSVEKIHNRREELGLQELVEISPLYSSKRVLLKMLMKLSERKTNSLSWKDFLNKGQAFQGKIDSPYDGDIPAIIVYTGGTTGYPKGVMLTNLNMNTMPINNEVACDFTEQRGETLLNFLPPFSAYSMVNGLHDPLSWGFRTIMIPMFQPTDFPKLMYKYRPNNVLSGPILWDYMMKDKKCDQLDLSFLNTPVSGGDSMSEEMEARINTYLSKHGCKHKIQQGYGMSEVAAAATYSTDKSYKSGSVGIPYFRNVLAAFDADTNEEKKYGEEGELRIAGPTTMKGYFGNDAATQETIYTDENGVRWVKTGDCGYLDEEGHVFIKGRIKRLIVRSGNKIFPITIENCMLTLPQIVGCAVVGLPNEKEKTVPVAHIVLKQGCEDTYEQIVTNIKEAILKEMPDFCIPAKFIFRKELPLTGMAKIDFKVLEKETMEYVDTMATICER